MRFKGLDLNLLVAFDALLETKSVSRAAERLNLSQPAMSAALARLREYFGDEILVADGKRMHPTAHAESLLPQVRELLTGADMLIATSTAFDPGTSQRAFRVIASDYITAALLAPLIRRLSAVAPQVRIEIVAPDAQSDTLLDRGQVDVIITPAEFIESDHPAEVLFEEEHVVACCAANPALKRGRIAEADFMGAGHVGVSMGSTRTMTFGDRQLETMGRRRRIEIVASSFTVVPWLLIGTARLAVMHARLAQAMKGYFPIAHAPLPFDFPVMREMIQVHRARVGDGGLAWLRQQLRAAAQGKSIHRSNGRA
ncbi:MAG: LysR family transcriptional regulator [Hyphomonadaceae bacterium]|nr:LysR family transcriptional regulator [Hyphomonadaceae bacterium]